MPELLSINRYESEYANFDTKYMAEINHRGLNEFRVLSDRDDFVLESKIDALVQKWNAKWIIVDEKLKAQKQLKNLKEKAHLMNQDLNEKFDSIRNILQQTLDIDDTIDWNSLKSKKVFDLRKPKKPKLETIPELNRNNTRYLPSFDFWDNIFKSRKTKKIKLCENRLKHDLAEYHEKLSELKNNFESKLLSYKNDVLIWESKKNDFEQQKSKSNSKIDELKSQYFSKNLTSIIEYCDLVLSNSNYISEFPQSFELDYVPDNQHLIVEYWLPEPEDIPKVKDYKFIASKKEIKEYPLPETIRKKMYDQALYQISLRSVHELFEADSANAIDIITFNGRVNFINKANGKKETACILSLQAGKKEFSDIDLANVEAKACFNALKGVGSSKLYGLTPIQPIAQFERNDSRFVEHYNVAHTLDESANLAAMNWEDFEHLIRELFMKEFQTEGGEVRVTQASKDGGVDAIAFDPNPIRGGKIVIQAKRYTNTVGVSAVRDLYGTVLNEGANKGILVTTANYGNDAYNFVKGKPLTLLSGNNLLHLLGKHGYKARINLKEAKEILKKETE